MNEETIQYITYMTTATTIMRSKMDMTKKAKALHILLERAGEIFGYHYYQLIRDLIEAFYRRAGN